MLMQVVGVGVVEHGGNIQMSIVEGNINNRVVAIAPEKRARRGNDASAISLWYNSC